jgi:hypothetical protein
MTPSAAGILGAWILITLLSLGFAGLMRHMQLLTAEVAKSNAGESTPALRDLTGYRLPLNSRIYAIASGSDTTAALFVSPSCVACHRMIDELNKILMGQATDIRPGPFQAVIVSTGDCPMLPRALEGFTLCMDNARDEHQVLHVAATPWLVTVDASGTVAYAGPAGSAETVVRKVLELASPAERLADVDLGELGTLRPDDGAIAIDQEG